MDWSPQQDQALQKVNAWIKGGSATPQLFRLFGFAGTGKTTLAKEIAAMVNGGVVFCTFTGKAAHVLRSKGCQNATTIHSLIYNPKDKSKKRLQELEQQMVSLRGQLLEANKNNPDYNLMSSYDYMKLNTEIEKERENLARPLFSLNLDSDIVNSALVIVDECSMVDGEMGQDLLSFGVKVLVLGDPAQLPPVKGTGFFINGEPDVMLTEIHRQAQDNPIIRMATDIRMGRALQLGDYGTSRVILKEDLQQSMVLDADQVLVGKNDTRFIYNKRIRSLLGRDNCMPETGDKLVCLRNDHAVGLLNGAIWFAKDIGAPGDDSKISLSITPQIAMGVDELFVEAHTHYFEGRAKELAWYEKRDAQEFDYGYALTCHKAQGSQWDNVLIFDESNVFRADSAKWLYTALTRAAEKAIIVRM